MRITFSTAAATAIQQQAAGSVPARKDVRQHQPMPRSMPRPRPRPRPGSMR
ncbi:hypothetical protein AB0I53_19655 [Saccharopolyspora sp. NPDC050389]|uniref:hypothetical protein n=1 Tax=Saccharopolyspora sp. NPDC050389 TaxID=3155516 RepID=UPI0033CC7B42